MEISNCFYRVSIKALVLNEERNKFLIVQEDDGELTLTFSRIGRYFGPDEPAVMFPSNIF